MNISFAPSNIIRKIGTEAAFRAMHETGFEACDFPITLYANGDYAKEGTGESLFDRPEAEVNAVFDEIARLATKHSVKISQTHAPYPSNTRDGDTLLLLPRHIELMRKAIRVTSRLGCGYIVIHPAFCHNINLDRNAEARAICRAENMRLYSALIPDLRTYGVRACLENMYGRDSETRLLCPTACSHATEMRDWIDALNAEAGEELFCACLDVGHCIITGDDPAAEIRVLGDRLRCLHLHDARPEHDAHTIPFLGDLDWNSIVDALRDVHYSGTLNFEAVNWPKFFPAELQTDALRLAAATANYLRDRFCAKD